MKKKKTPDEKLLRVIKKYLRNHGNWVYQMGERDRIWYSRNLKHRFPNLSLPEAVGLLNMRFNYEDGGSYEQQG